MKTDGERRKPTAVFMAFGTKGDVHPIAAIAAAFACEQKQYQVALITHSAHEDMMVLNKEICPNRLQLCLPTQKSMDNNSNELPRQLTWSSKARTPCFPPNSVNRKLYLKNKSKRTKIKCKNRVLKD